MGRPERARRQRDLMAHDQYRDRYGSTGGSGLGAGPILAVGLVLLIVGLIVAVHGLTGGVQLPPAAAQQIPVTVKTTSPRGPDPVSVAAALAPSTPTQIEIPAIGVRAPIMQVGQNADGTVQVPPPDNHNLAAWYDGSVRPGQDGSSVILGHVDTYQGPSVFYSIKNLRRGDAVDVVRADGGTAVFTVIGVEEVEKASFPTDSVYDNVAYPALRLITCGGPFDSAQGSYLDNIVVYAYLSGVASG
jgi:LPXTG-site transpeptidase (sortase) family protein